MKSGASASLWILTAPGDADFARGAIAKKVLAEPHVTDSERSEDLTRDKLVIRSARNRLDDATEYTVAEVGIGKFCPRSEIQRLAHGDFDDLARVNGQPATERSGNLLRGLRTHRIQ
jgi:hypothetical protein